MDDKKDFGAPDDRPSGIPTTNTTIVDYATKEDLKTLDTRLYGRVFNHEHWTREAFNKAAQRNLKRHGDLKKDLIELRSENQLDHSDMLVSLKVLEIKIEEHDLAYSSQLQGFKDEKRMLETRVHHLSRSLRYLTIATMLLGISFVIHFIFSHLINL